jgi:hypothetical protein
MLVRNVLIIATAFVLCVGGFAGCQITISRECESTRREALKSTEPDRMLVLSRHCV